LGVDINDVWICAVAWEHGLTLLTQDKMKQIRSVVPEINVESWI
jgi:predicted nucleic acid-binding protein